MKNKGRPSQNKKKAPLFKGQHGSTIPKGTPSNEVPSYYTQKNFRCPQDTKEMLDELAATLELSDTDVIKLGIVFLARNLPLVKGQLSRRELSLVTRVTFDSKRFAPFLRARPGGSLSVDLLAVLGDFAAIQNIEDKSIRTQAFAGLHQKIQLIFKQAQELRVIEEPGFGGTTGVELG